MQAFAERGATIAQTPREVADASDVVITMLPSSPHVHARISFCLFFVTVNAWNIMSNAT